MRSILPLLLVAAAPAGALAAEAADFNARNPAHCAAALEATYEIVKSDPDLATDMRQRIVWQRLSLDSEGEDEGAAIRRRLGTDSDLALRHAQACIRRQDAHPRFRALALQQELEPMPGDEPVSVSAALERMRRSAAPERLTLAQN